MLVMSSSISFVVSFQITPCTCFLGSWFTLTTQNWLWFTLSISVSSSYLEFKFLFGSPIRGPLRISLRTFTLLPLSVLDLGLFFHIISAMAPKRESAST